jgi:Ala-tRNA(Pro) deacylase
VASVTEIFAFLDRLGVSYTGTEHPAAFTMDDLLPIEAQLGAPFFRNLFLTNRQKTEFYLLLIGGHKPFRTSVVSKLLGVARLSFGDADALMEKLGVVPGAVNPLSLLGDPDKRIHLVIDRELKTIPRLCLHPGDNSRSIVMDSADLFGTVIPALGHEPTWIEIPEQTE